MKIKTYIVTYNSPGRINPCLNSIFKSDYQGEVNVISNHTNHGIKNEYFDKINLLENQCRPDWSTGHLSRSWNQCIIHGFKMLTNPGCDVLILAQDDTLFQTNFQEKAIELAKSYDFIQQGHGDGCMLFTPRAIKEVGLWDERFHFAMHAADYFWRCVLHLRNKASISDPGHNRTWNSIGSSVLIKPESRSIANKHFPPQRIDISISANLIKEKYGYDPHPWTPEKIDNSKPEFKIKNYIYYPYFEKDINNLKEKNYML